GLAVLALICRHDLWQSPRGRFYLLPGAQGFVLLDGRIVLNPSYWPAFQMQYLAEIDPAGPWHNLQHTAERKQITLMPKGFAPDWIAIDPATGQASPAPQGVMGGYDAIRVYLWQGMSAGLDAVGAGSTDYGLLQGMAHYLKDHPNPPEWVNTQTGQASGEGNLGFKAALIPYLNAVGNHHQAHVYLAEIHKEIRRTGLVSKDYYPNNLGLFALAYLMGTNTLARRFKG
ncbi:MAG: glycosyl hydrolase family 8, partial [Halothiobacillus sp.]